MLFFFFFLMGAAPLPLRLRSSPASQPRATSPAYSVAQPGAGPLPPAGTCEAPRLSAAPGVLRRSEDQQISTHGRPGERWREGRAGWEGPGCNPAMFFIFHVFLKTCGCLQYFSVPLRFFYIESYTQHSSNISQLRESFSYILMFLDTFFSCYSELNVFFFVSFLFELLLLWSGFLEQ